MQMDLKWNNECKKDISHHKVNQEWRGGGACSLVAANREVKAPNCTI